MTTVPTCTSCQQPLSADTPLGLCPQCLLKGGFYTGSAPTGRGGQFTAPSVEELAAHFPQLEIMELVGRGGMGAVYKARQPRLNRDVALKILARDSSDDARFSERFQREAQALARLNHPNIVTVYDFGEAGGHFYLVMEFVDGLNLRQLEQSKKLTPAEALAIVPPICEAMQYAHERGIVHRDIKPENILVDKDGRVKLADFGIAKLLGSEPQEALTGDDQRVGTPHYMAPEQVEKPTTVDHRADIYSLGVVFYEMLTGELPLGRFAPPSRKVQIDVRLDEIVLRALEKEPELRFQQAHEIRTEVEFLSTPAPEATDSVAPPQPPQPSAIVKEQTSKLAKGAGYLAAVVFLGAVSPLPLGAPERIVLLLMATGLFVMYQSLRKPGAGGATAADKKPGIFEVAFKGEVNPTTEEKLGAIGLYAFAMAVGLAILVFVIPVGFAGKMVLLVLVAGFLASKALAQNALKRNSPTGEIADGKAQPLKRSGIALLAIPGIFLGATALFHVAGFYATQQTVFAVAAAVMFSIIAYGIRKAAAPVPLPSAPDPLPSLAADARLSRTALIGAMWGIIGIVGLAGALTSFKVPQGSGQPYQPALWMLVARFTLLPLVLAAPFATTIMGAVARVRIRSSKGSVYGLALAAFDILLYPMLACGIGLGLVYKWLLYRVVQLVVMRGQYEWLEPLAIADGTKIAVVFAVLSTLIIGLVLWRKLVAPARTGLTPIVAAPQRPGMFRPVAIIAVLLLCGALLWVAKTQTDWFGSNNEELYPDPEYGASHSNPITKKSAFGWLKSRTIRGQVVDTTTGMPIAGAQVSLRSSEVPDSLRKRTAKTDNGGNYEISINHSEEYSSLGGNQEQQVPLTLWILAPGYMSMQANVPQYGEEVIVTDLHQNNQGPDSPRMTSDRSLLVKKVSVRDSTEDGFGVYVFASNTTTDTQHLAVEFFNQPTLTAHEPTLNVFRLGPLEDKNLFMQINSPRPKERINHAEVTISRTAARWPAEKFILQYPGQRLMGTAGPQLIFHKGFMVPPRGDFNLQLLNAETTTTPRLTDAALETSTVLSKLPEWFSDRLGPNSHIHSLMQKHPHKVLTSVSTSTVMIKWDDPTMEPVSIGF